MMKGIARYIAAVLSAGLFIFGVAGSAYGQQCLIVRSAEGHRFRNSMIAGALTGGIGFAAGGAFSGAKYEYVDGVNFTSTKLKYKGGELQKLQEQGVHVVVINKKAQADETKSARESCKDFVQQSHPAAPPPAAAPAPAQPQAPAAPQGTTAAPSTAAAVISPMSSEPQQQSLGDAAKRYREQKQEQQSDTPHQH